VTAAPLLVGCALHDGADIDACGCPALDSPGAIAYRGLLVKAGGEIARLTAELGAARAVTVDGMIAEVRALRAAAEEREAGCVALADECERLRGTVSALDLKVSDAEQSHMAAIATERRRREAVEIERDGAALDRRRHFALYTREHEINATLTTRIATLEAELVQARAHQCGGIVLGAEDADRIAALLEEQPGPTPAMVALFAKAKE